jgi:hypothetical protein
VTVRIYAPSDPSMLVPHQAEIGWTDISRVLSDAVPSPSGVGASQIAQQALGLSPDQAASLVAAAGATALPATALSALSQPQPPKVIPRGVNATRLPIPSTINTSIALVNGDPNRSFVIIQNNNATGGANLLVSVDAKIDTTQPWAYLNLLPNSQGILLDQEVMVNPIYVAWATGTVIGGMILYGSRAPVTVVTH